MSSREAQHYWEHVGLVRLVAGVLLAPAAWLIDLQVSYVAVKWACATGRHDVLLLVPLGSLAVIGMSGWLSWSCWRMLRDHSDLDGARMEDRSYFLALAGLGMSAIFGVLVLVSLAPRYLLSPCE